MLTRTSAVFQVVIMVAIFWVAIPGVAQAQLAIFQTEMLAQFHCPADSVVWLDFTKRRYYVAGQKKYAQGRTAVFACREEARKNGYRRSVLGRR